MIIYQIVVQIREKVDAMSEAHFLLLQMFVIIFLILFIVDLTTIIYSYLLYSIINRKKIVFYFDFINFVARPFVFGKHFVPKFRDSRLTAAL